MRPFKAGSNQSGSPRPTAIPATQVPDSRQSQTQRQPTRSLCDKGLQGSRRDVITPQEMPAPDSIEGMTRTLVREISSASERSSDEQKALIAKRLESRRRRLRAIEAKRQPRCSLTRRARLESRVRSVIRRVPRPLQRLVGHIYPRFSPDYVLSLEDYSQGGRS